MDNLLQPRYYPDGEAFVFEDYHRAKPFSSFLPGVAGLYGKPFWAFYVNRGQGVAGMGFNNRQNPIMEFYPANKAYQMTSSFGFRTFLKIRRRDESTTNCYEPFQDYLKHPDYLLEQEMRITTYDLRLVETNHTLGLKVSVEYHTLPGENIPGLIRRVTLQNISGRPLEIEILDGMPVIIPYPMDETGLKHGSNSLESFILVEHPETVPFFKYSVLPSSNWQAEEIPGGNFYLSFTATETGGLSLNPMIIDPRVVFGPVMDCSVPVDFYQKGFAVPGTQVSRGIMPCAFGYGGFALKEGGSAEIFSLIGHAPAYERVTHLLSSVDRAYLEAKTAENRNLIMTLQAPIFTVSSHIELDAYFAQTFLDNTLRGGYPIRVGRERHVFHVFHRKHGDLERDYNQFHLPATGYSQGETNYRDVNQNRRHDLSFFPFVGTTDLETFLNYLRLDGYASIPVKALRFYLEDLCEAEATIQRYFSPETAARVLDHVRQSFTPGGVLDFLEQQGLKSMLGNDAEFLDELLALSNRYETTDFREKLFYIDFWTYNTDLLAEYRAIYPDRIRDLLWREKKFTFHDSAAVVLPRERKYLLVPGKGVRQLGAVVESPEKLAALRGRPLPENKVRTGYGAGEIYYCTLLVKLLGLLTIKIATLDPEGVGVEMEANGCGWDDSLNGLPALLTSSVNESAEIKRLAVFLLELIAGCKADDEYQVSLPEELYAFWRTIFTLLQAKEPLFTYWDQSSRAREEFRAITVHGLSGREKVVEVPDIITFLKAVIAKIEAGLQKAYNREDGLYYTYFYNEVTDYEIIRDEDGLPEVNENGFTRVLARAFKQRPLPYFLEGPARILKTVQDPGVARGLYRAVRQSELYDNVLQMYKACASMQQETRDVGRQAAWPRGWIENEAVFLHVEYKFLLGLLESGLYEEFWAECPRVLVPFMDPRVYGRSTRENVSFIVSSVHPDPSRHGAGFAPRLTGSAAEVLSMWRFITAGLQPFTLNPDGELSLSFRPVLPGWLFTEKPLDLVSTQGEIQSGRFVAETLSLPAHVFAFRFLGKTLVVYHNESRKDTYGKKAAQIKGYRLQCGQRMVEVDGEVIPAPYALDIRLQKTDRMDVFLQ